MVEYLLNLLIMTSLYAILVVSFDLVAGQTGMLSLAHAAFYGIGAYGSAIVAGHLGGSFVTGVVAGAGCAASVAAALGWCSIQLRDDYFAIGSFGFQVIFISLATNLTPITRGPFGIAGIPSPSLAGWVLDSKGEMAALCVLVAGAAYWLVRAVSTSPLGRVLRALREDGVLVEVLGKDSRRVRVVVIVFTACLSSVAGSLYAHFVSFVDPSSFGLTESILIVTMLILGGADSPLGPLVGAFSLVTLPEFLRLLPIPSAAVASLRQVLYGVLLVAMVAARPQGLVGRTTLGR